MPLVIARMVDLKSHLLTDNVFEGDRVVFGEQIGREMEWLRDCLMPAKALKKESIFAERRQQRNESVLLSVCHRCKTSRCDRCPRSNLVRSRRLRSGYRGGAPRGRRG